MEPERFDRLAMVVGRGKSRRGVLRGLLGSALVAGGLVQGGPSEEAAAREGAADGWLGGRHRHRTHGDKKDKKQDHDGARLGSGAPCHSPKTRCGQGKNQTCVDTRTDPNNCGACGTACGTGGICCAGVCQEGDCCTTADCGFGEQCEQHRCTCAGCRDSTTHVCLNGTCAKRCGNMPGRYGSGCPATCACGGGNIHGNRVCIQPGLTCADIPTTCTIMFDCPRGYQCSNTLCGNDPLAGEKRCVPLCTA
jgi:hypothetical protein